MLKELILNWKNTLYRKSKRKCYPQFMNGDFTAEILQNNIVSIEFTKNVEIDSGTSIQLELKTDPVRLTPGQIIP